MSSKNITICDECGKEKPQLESKHRNAVPTEPDPWRAFAGGSPYKSLDLCSPNCVRDALSKIGADPSLMRIEALKNAPDLAGELSTALATITELRSKLVQARPITPQDVRDAAVDVFREVKDFLEHLTEQARDEGRAPPPLARSLFAKLVQKAGDALNR